MKKGFTLMELLAVIVLLAIIAIIATPIILNIIENTNKSSFKESANFIIDAAVTQTALKDMNNIEEIVYEYKDGNWVGDKLEIDGLTPKYVSVSINKEGKSKAAISDGKYCSIKEYDGRITIKRIGNKNTDTTIKEKYCILNPPKETNVECFKYTVSNNKVTITDYYDYEEDDSNNVACPRSVVIPENMNSKPVTSIGKKAFYENNLVSVTIPDTVINIGDSAFSSNQLTSITIPDGVTIIGYNVFSDNQLTSVEIPNSVTSIGNSAFSYNELSSITIPNSVTSIGSRAFSTNQLTKVRIPNSVTSIGDYAFFTNKLTSVEIPTSVTRIGEGAFSTNKLSSITIPDSITSIENNAFSSNQLTSVEIPNSVTNIGNFAFGNNFLTNIIIPNSVTSIGNDVFRYNKLISVIIKGKSSTSDFTSYPTSTPFGWASVCDDTKCIAWEAE